jgi:hypothetical protein
VIEVVLQLCPDTAIKVVSEMSTAARPDLPAHSDAIRLPFNELITELRALLGVRLVAYLASVRETRAVNQWSDGTRETDADTARRLRDAFVIAKTLAQNDPPSVVQSWFQGLNPLLDDRSPARLLREGEPDDAGPQVLAAARAFLATG